MSRVILLTGGRGVGKSTVCGETVALAEQRRYRCGGVITLTEAGARDVLDVGSGRRRRLTRAPEEGPVVTQGRFHFDPRTLDWGREVLSHTTPCDLLVVDELGPLEVERGRGWVIALDLIRAGRYALALLVVRPELVARVRGEISCLPVEVLRVTRENRDRLPVMLVGALERDT